MFYIANAYIFSVWALRPASRKGRICYGTYVGYNTSDMIEGNGSKGIVPRSREAKGFKE